MAILLPVTEHGPVQRFVARARKAAHCVAAVSPHLFSSGLSIFLLFCHQFREPSCFCFNPGNQRPTAAEIVFEGEKARRRRMRRGRDCRCGPCCPGARRPPLPFVCFHAPGLTFVPCPVCPGNMGPFFLALTKLVSGLGLALYHFIAKASSKARRCNGRKKWLILFFYNPPF